MRPPANPGQQSGEQKKSVFDRLGRQLDPGRPPNRRSPACYGEHPMYSAIHEPSLPPPDFGGGGRYPRGECKPDIDWRYERRQQQQQQQQHMQFGRPDRHPSQIGPPPMAHYDMDMLGPGRQPPPYYQHPHAPQFPPGPMGNIPPMLGGPDPMPISMHQQRRPSPKYDRHGNPIRGPIRMDHLSGVSPSRNFMGPPMPGPPMMSPAGYDMIPMRPGMYPQERWDESMEMGPQMPKLLPTNDRFMDQSNQRFQGQHRQQKGPTMLLNPDVMLGPQPNFEAPRYSKWRERRNVITNLDRQTAQSSSKTDSLKSSLQQPDNRGNMSRRARGRRANEQLLKKQQSNIDNKKESEKLEKLEKPEKPETKVATKKEPAKKKDPQDISDGEIVDDEDSSDDSDVQRISPCPTQAENTDTTFTQSRNMPGYVRKPQDGQFHDSSKRRRLHDRDEYSMNYETISDEELDEFMSDKKLGEDKDGECKEGSNSSEIELLNALGLDWANLIEMSKQSRKEAPASDSALRRFSVQNYLPTLGISRELAGPEIYDLIVKITG